jgi:hypothetical protein
MQRPSKRARLLYSLAALFTAFSLLASIFVIQQVRAQDDTPVGQWSVALGRTDIPVDVASSFSYVGRWRLGINADGTYEAERSDVGVVVSGVWEAEGDQITFTDEDGLLSCANAAAAPIINDDLDSGTYTWERSGKTLTLTRVDDACPGRVILLTTFAFTTFVPCTTEPLSMAALLGSPVAEDVPPPVASPTVSLEVILPDGSPVAPASPAAAGPPLPGAASPAAAPLDFATEIDELLAQLTACWATREPERWLPLLSDEFRDALIASDPNFLETLTISMSSPIVWERSGDVTIEAPNQLSAIVKSTVGTEEDFQRFIFIFEDGKWKWNG